MTKRSKRSNTVWLLASLAMTAAGQQIGSGCNSFLTSLDADATLQSCTSNLLNVTSAFNPTNATDADSQHSLVSITDTLKALCQSSVHFCDMATLSDVLNAFSGNCTNELAGPTAVPSVVTLYDTLYILKPMKDAMCSTNPTSGNACMLDIAGTSKSSDQDIAADAVTNATASIGSTSNIAPANSTLRTYNMLNKATSFDLTRFAGVALNPSNLYVQTSTLSKRWLNNISLLKRQEVSVSSAAPSASARSRDRTTEEDSTQDNPTAGIVTANITTFRSANIPYLFLNSAMPATQLCQPCTQAIMAAYLSFESQIPYAGGLPNSYLLGAQAPFWKALGAKCGQQFLTEINGQAGQNTQFSGALRQAAPWTILATALVYLTL